MNEPRYEAQSEEENVEGTTLRAWVDEMGAFVKKIDPNHLLSAGIEGHGTQYGFGGDEGNPIEAHFGPLRQFTIANSNHPNHPVQTRALHACLLWRNANARHRDVLAAERKERARIRSEKGTRWGGRPLNTTA